MIIRKPNGSFVLVCGPKSADKISAGEFIRETIPRLLRVPELSEVSNCKMSTFASVVLLSLALWMMEKVARIWSIRFRKTLSSRNEKKVGERDLNKLEVEIHEMDSFLLESVSDIGLLFARFQLGLSISLEASSSWRTTKCEKRRKKEIEEKEGRENSVNRFVEFNVATKWQEMVQRC